MGWLSKLFNLDDINNQQKPSTNTSEGYNGDGTKDLRNSRNAARNRLKLVLMHDRTKLAPETIEQMRDELIGVISKYVEIDNDALKLDLETESNTIALVANIPVLRSRGTEDLPAARPAKLPEATAKKALGKDSTSDDKPKSAPEKTETAQPTAKTTAESKEPVTTK